MNFYSQFVADGDLCFDIGAHVGNHMRAFLNLGARVIAVEPQPYMMKFLKIWYGRNEHATLIEAALGERDGIECLQVSSRTPTISSLSPEWIDKVKETVAFSSAQWDRLIEVDVITLDSLIKIYGQPSFCKIDAEGYELNIFKGLSRPIRAVSFEYLPATKEVAIKCVQHLGSLGNYKFNWTAGEVRRFYHNHWVNQQEMTTYLENLQPDRRSGDVYAQLV
ncbi:MAG: FkbM family methyltransferase [Anaerolineales bacterium]